MPKDKTKCKECLMNAVYLNATDFYKAQDGTPTA